jgi:hypothetical protein
MVRTSITSRNKGLGVLLIFFALVIVGVGCSSSGRTCFGRAMTFRSGTGR